MRSKTAAWTLVLATFAMLSAPAAPANGSKGKRVVYEAVAPLGESADGVCRFTVEIEPILFHIATVQNKYKTFRINIRNTGRRPLKLSLQTDSVQITVGSKTVNGILDVSEQDPAWWDALSADLRKALAYPDQEPVQAGEEENVFVFVPIVELSAFPEEILFTITSLSTRPISIQKYRARAAFVVSGSHWRS